MIEVIEVYNDVLKDTVGSDENGFMSIDMFNRLSKRAELDLMEWLTGDVSGIIPPAPWLTQKNKDWLSPFLVKTTGQIVNGRFSFPADYYQYDNWYILNGREYCEEGCDPQEQRVLENIPIEVLEGTVYNERLVTDIDELKATFENPISKQLGKGFTCYPSDLGSVGFEYIRYPIFAAIVPINDPVYNDVVPDPNNGQDYEWDPAVKRTLIWIIADYFANNTREQALKTFNAATGKVIREQKE